ncbi:hypothetical protein AND_007152 [Anopheles darlingi]|uniref:Secreted protein n=1 Tax=Anopheles darlingi TaxID=43151 RepID=W5JE67_ANODA|nr:hypothetical protein AND_007152 [Anopheles darlingi]
MLQVLLLLLLLLQLRKACLPSLTHNTVIVSIIIIVVERSKTIVTLSSERGMAEGKEKRAVRGVVKSFSHFAPQKNSGAPKARRFVAPLAAATTATHAFVFVVVVVVGVEIRAL